MSERFLDPSEAAAFLTEEGHKVSKATLAKWRCLGGGPVYQKFGRLIRYRPSRLTEFAATRVSPELRSTSETTDS
jgi:hypothetical protein